MQYANRSQAVAYSRFADFGAARGMQPAAKRRLEQDRRKGRNSFSLEALGAWCRGRLRLAQISL
jgi:hypothetical protein